MGRCLAAVDPGGLKHVVPGHGRSRRAGITGGGTPPYIEGVLEAAEAGLAKGQTPER